MVSEPGFDRRGSPVLHELALQPSAVDLTIFLPSFGWLFTLTYISSLSLIFRLFALTQIFLGKVFTEQTHGWEGEYF